MLSYSDIITHQRCPKQFEYSVERNLQKKRRDVNMTKGSYVHELLMAYYQEGTTFQERYEEMAQEVLTVTLDDEVIEADDLLEEALDLVLRYVEKYNDDWEVLHVEETFEVEIDGTPISFTPDLVIRDGRGVWIVDHKTTSRMPDGNIGVGDYQAFLYSSAMMEIYPDFRGFIFNRLRKKVPTQPRLTKTGKTRVANVGRIDTTYEMLRDFIQEEAPELMDDETHRRRLAELRDEDRFFFREYVFTPEEVAQELLEDTKRVLVDIEHHRRSRFPRIFLPYAGAQECTNCEFSELCVAELRGYNVEHVLDFYEERDRSHRQYDYDLEEL